MPVGVFRGLKKVGITVFPVPKYFSQEEQQQITTKKNR